jgi:hypothetical protein
MILFLSYSKTREHESCTGICLVTTGDEVFPEDGREARKKQSVS